MNWRVTVKRRGGEGHRVDKRGRDKRQRDGEARQIPIIYSAARSAQFALGFLRLRFPHERDGQPSVWDLRVGAGSRLCDQHKEDGKKAMIEVIECAGVAAPGVRKL